LTRGTPSSVDRLYKPALKVHLHTPPFIHTAANGHQSLESGAADPAWWLRACTYLEKVLCFSRTGKTEERLDEAIHQSFERGDLVLLAGWDNWSGNYLLTESDEGDKVLHHLFCEVVSNDASQPC